MKIPEKPPQWGIYLINEEDSYNLLDSDEVNSIRHRINETDYLYWTDIKHLKFKDGISSKDIWRHIRFERNFNSQGINLNKNEEFKFRFYSTNYIQKKLHEFDLNFGGKLVSESIIPEEEKNKYLLSSIMEEAIASSQIEGAVTTRKVAKDMLRKERKPRNKSEQMIINNFTTIKRISELKNAQLTPHLLLELHKLITNETLKNEENEGQFRETNKIKVVDGVTGNVIYDPPDFKTLNKLINDLCKFANTESKSIFIHPIVKASILHFLIGYIHPFVDGNGRTARAVFYWFLLSKGYWLIEYMSISRLIIKSKTQYANAFLYTELDSNDITYFVNYQIKNLDKAFVELKNYILRKIKEVKQLHELRKFKDLNERQVSIIKLFVDHSEKLVTIKEIQNRFGVVYQTARTDLMGLEKLKFLESRTSGRKQIIYFRSQYFEKIINNI